MITMINGRPVLSYNFSAKRCETKEPKRLTASASAPQHRASVPLTKSKIKRSVQANAVS